MTQIQHSLTPEDQKRLSELFDSLDVDKDGRIDVNDLTEALQQLEVPVIPGQAQKFIEENDQNKDGGLDFREFVHYVLEHEKQLKLSFGLLDHNKDGVLDTDEIMKAFQKLGVQIERPEAERILRRMDKDGTLRISWEEYRSYLLLHPSSDIWDIVHYWRHASCDHWEIHHKIIDVGEDALVPDDFTENELQSGMWWRHLVAGAAAGAVSRTCTAPLDRLKVFLQVHGSHHNNLGIITGFQHMLSEGGMKSFWRGNGINVLKIAPESALKFMAYEQIKKLIRGETMRDLGIQERFIAGSLAGAISQTTIYPMEVLKTRLALRKTGQYSGIKDCARNIYKQEGVRSFYKGYIPNLLGIIPYAGIDLCVYETLKRFYLSHYTIDSDPGVLVLLACGTISSTCGQLASYPLALVRTKLQAQVVTEPSISNGTALMGSSHNSTMVSLFRHILETEGPKGLYRGITPNFMKVIPAVSISYVVYEKARRFLGVEMT